MSYPRSLSDPKAIHKLLLRKEYAQLKPTLHEPTLSDLDMDIQKSGNLQLNTYQKFVNNLISPNTPYTRLLIKHETGTGKTVTIVSTAMQFAKGFSEKFKILESIETEDHVPSVVIIGFSKQIFYKEILRRPEFGFVTREEVVEHQRLRSIASQTGLKSDRDASTEYHSMLKKRLSKRSRGGMFKFYGYKEFFNRLFIFTEEGIEKLSKEFNTQLDKSSLDEDQLLLGIKKNYIQINYELIDQLADSIFICDEIHNVYNSTEINNYGLAIRIALMIHEDPVEMSKWIKLDGKTVYQKSRMDLLQNSVVRAMFMSATPINNSPTEVIDLINLWIPIRRLREVTNKIRLNKEDFFLDNRNLKPKALEIIRKLIRGFVSFLSDTNPMYFPTYEILGEEQKIPTKSLPDRATGFKGTTIPYLKFHKCPMSTLHERTYRHVFKGTLPPDGQSLLDIVLPNPNDPKIGLFKTKDIKFQIPAAPLKWKQKNQIDLVQQSIGSQETWVITGEFMHMPALSEYSTKYAEMVKEAINNLKKDLGKTMINHQQVKMSGALFAAEVLRKNGIIDEFAEPGPNTLCVYCGISMHGHKQKHDFAPARFILIHGDIDKSSQDRSLEKFHGPDNINGEQIRFLIGSKIINEGVDFKEVQNLWVLKVPDNYPVLLQILGRAIRKGSHLRLPPEKRHVRIQIFASTNSSRYKDELSYEMRRYFEKSQDYLVVQDLERILNEEAIDASLNRNIIFPSDANTKKPGLGKLYYPLIGPQLNPSLREVDLSTFNPFHTDDELATIVYIIKRLFMEKSQVWTYKELWESVQKPPFDVQLRTDLLLEKNFALTLQNMLAFETTAQSIQIDTYSVGVVDMGKIDRLFDSDNTIITIGDTDCKIVYINGLYILFPISRIKQSKTFTNDEKRMQVLLGKNAVEISGVPDIDIENWHRYAESRVKTSINITKHLQTSSVSYDQLKLRFYRKYHKLPIKDFPTSIEIYGIDFHIRLAQDAIKYVFLVLTNPKMPFSELHEFYFKVLYFYDKLDLILFARDVQGSSIEAMYAPYVTKGTIRRKTKLEESMVKDEKHNAFLMSSILKTAGLSKPFQINVLNAFLGKSKTPQALKYKPKNVSIANVIMDFKKWYVPPTDKKNITQVYADMLPIGHFINSEQTISSDYSIPTILNLQSEQLPWIKSTEFTIPKSTLITEVENNIIVGYYDQTTSGIELKFKLRAPKHKLVKHEDSRLIERGAACNTRKKEELLDIVKMLKISDTDSTSIRSLCSAIKLDLMRREMIERRAARAAVAKNKKYTQTRWFYLHFEQSF